MQWDRIFTGKLFLGKWTIFYHVKLYQYGLKLFILNKIFRAKPRKSEITPGAGAYNTENIWPQGINSWFFIERAFKAKEDGPHILWRVARATRKRKKCPALTSILSRN